MKPSAEYIFAVIASPVGSYFRGGPAPVSIWVSENYTRAAIGGTGTHIVFLLAYATARFTEIGRC